MIHQMMPAEAAAELKAWLARRGAVFSLTEHDEVRCDLNGVADIRTEADAERISIVVLTLRDELRVILRAEKTTH